MLKSYSAEISGSQVVWIDEPPQNLKRQPVLVVIENSAAQSAASANSATSGINPATKLYDLSDLVGQLAWRGDAVGQQRGQRDAW
jgi:hypothetical protein